jgi:hypothetical protein
MLCDWRSWGTVPAPPLPPHPPRPQVRVEAGGKVGGRWVEGASRCLASLHDAWHAYSRATQYLLEEAAVEAEAEAAAAEEEVGARAFEGQAAAAAESSDGSQGPRRSTDSGGRESPHIDLLQPLAPGFSQQ